MLGVVQARNAKAQVELRARGGTSDGEDKNEEGDEDMEEAGPSTAKPPLPPPESTPTDGIGAPTPLPSKSKGGKSKKRAAASAEDAQKDKPPTKRTRGNARLAHFAALSVKKIPRQKETCPCRRTTHHRNDCQYTHEWTMTQGDYDRFAKYVTDPSSRGFDERLANALRPMRNDRGGQQGRGRGGYHSGYNNPTRVNQMGQEAMPNPRYHG
jgi:hypothetical protein